MIILGLTVLWHDITAALLIDGKIAGIIEEERLSRQKHHKGTFDPISIPWLSIKNLLENNSLKIEDIDYIAINYSPSEALLWRAKSHNIIVNFIWNLFKNLHIKYDVKKNFKNKIIFVPHHIAHASSAIFGSGFKECAFISCDGGGENKSIYLGEFKKGEINVIETYSNYYSIGFLYEFIADYLLNLGIGEGSGKMMGLSSYGNPDTFKDVFDKIIKIDDSQFIVKKDLNFPGSNELSNFLRKHFKFRKKEEKIINNYYEHIAATVQSIIEDVLIFLIKKLLKKTKQKKLVFAGGVGLNSKANFKILKKLKLKENDFYIFPQANDAGGAIGSAYYVYYSITKKFPQPIQHTYWGTEYDNNYIYKLLKKNKLKYKTLEYDNLFNYIANKLCEGKIVGWFQGKMEIGPRALGNRSILMHPGIKNGKDIINMYVKNREGWRPFALSILKEYASLYLKNLTEAKFMIINDEINLNRHSEILAGVHVDNTTRPQIVSRESNERYYSLIKSFGDLSGTYALLNTSFNLAGEPIVEKPEQAIADFFNSGMDILVIENFILEK